MDMISKYIFLILLTAFYLNGQGQDVSGQATITTAKEKTSKVQQGSSSDPKLVQLGLIPGQEMNSVNPARITTPLSDPKLKTDESQMGKSGGGTISRPTGPDVDPKLEAESLNPTPEQTILPVGNEKVSKGKVAKGHIEQPLPEPVKNVTNFRNIKGPDKQPVPVKTAKVTNFRQLNMPHEQPAGEKPKR